MQKLFPPGLLQNLDERQIVMVNPMYVAAYELDKPLPLEELKRELDVVIDSV